MPSSSFRSPRPETSESALTPFFFSRQKIFSSLTPCLTASTAVTLVRTTSSPAWILFQKLPQLSQCSLFSTQQSVILLKYTSDHGAPILKWLPLTQSRSQRPSNGLEAQCSMAFPLTPPTHFHFIPCRPYGLLAVAFNDMPALGFAFAFPWNALPSDSLMCFSLTSFTPLHKCHLPTKAFPDQPT